MDQYYKKFLDYSRLDYWLMINFILDVKILFFFKMGIIVVAFIRYLSVYCRSPSLK